MTSQDRRAAEEIALNTAHPNNRTNCADAILAALQKAREEERSKWQPIETASKDGTTILVYGKRARSDRDMPRCGDCVHWTRGGLRCLWGHCDVQFECGAGEPSMWDDAPIGHDKHKICTHETFGCVNFRAIRAARVKEG